MQVTIYTSSHTDSSFCTDAKSYLTSKGITFTEKDVYKDKAALEEMLTKSDKFSGVPFTHVVKDDGSEHKLKGFTKEEYDKVFVSAEANTSASTAPTTPTGQTTAQAPIPPVTGAASSTATTTMPMPGVASEPPAPTAPAPAMTSAPAPTPAAPLDSEAKSRIDSLLSDLQAKTEPAVAPAATEVPPAPVSPVAPTPTPPNISSSANQPIAPTGGDLPKIPDFPGK